MAEERTALSDDEILTRVRSFNKDFDKVHPAVQFQPVLAAYRDLLQLLSPDERRATLPLLEALWNAIDNVTEGYKTAVGMSFDFGEELLASRNKASALKNERDHMIDQAFKVGGQLFELQEAIRLKKIPELLIDDHKEGEDD